MPILFYIVLSFLGGVAITIACFFFAAKVMGPEQETDQEQLDMLDWISCNCYSFLGRWRYKGNTYSSQEIIRIYKSLKKSDEKK